MAPKKKKNKLLVKLISGAGTGFFYLFKKTPQIAQKKLALRKFDPIVNQYVVFNEAKLKFSTSTGPSTPTPKFRFHPGEFIGATIPWLFFGGIVYYFTAPRIDRLSASLTTNLYQPYPAPKGTPEQEAVVSRRVMEEILGPKDI